MKGTYLQNARTITSDDPAVDGLYEAILHPVLANDLFRGDYRDISIQYLGSTSELNEIYRSLIHMMRHEFTRLTPVRSSMLLLYGLMSCYGVLENYQNSSRIVNDVHSVLLSHY